MILCNWINDDIPPRGEAEFQADLVHLPSVAALGRNSKPLNWPRSFSANSAASAWRRSIFGFKLARPLTPRARHASSPSMIASRWLGACGRSTARSSAGHSATCAGPLPRCALRPGGSGLTSTFDSSGTMTEGTTNSAVALLSSQVSPA